MRQRSVSDPEFGTYGRVISGYDVTELMAEMMKTPLPEEVIYVPSVPELEQLSVAAEIAGEVYGQMPIQIGFCNGHNTKLNAVEYHRDSELNLAVTDLVLLLGRQQDITEDFTYDTSLVEAFFVPAGTLIEVYATTLHYAPCHIKESPPHLRSAESKDNGFRCVVVLPKGTNEELAPREPRPGNGEEKLLFARNKWLVGHEEAGLPANAWIGLKGKNVEMEDISYE